MRNRLQEIKWSVENADNSARDDLREGDEEINLRRWLQRNLSIRANNRYTTPQEGEIDLMQRPDLRIENPNTDPVSIEVKWADNWTLDQLLERLENQLVGQYLRAQNSRYGIYFLGINGKKKTPWKDTKNNKNVGFEEMVEIVRKKARELLGSSSEIDGLEIVTIDFRQPKRA